MKIKFRNYVITNNFRFTKLEPIVIGFRSGINRYSIYDVRNRHMPIIDYDDLPKAELKEDIRKIQRKFKLSHAIVARSSFGTVYRPRWSWEFPYFRIKKDKIDKWHVFFPFNARNYFDIIPIIHFSKCDRQYKKWRMLRDSMVARYTPKSNKMTPVIKFIVKSPYEGQDYGYLDQIAETLEQESGLSSFGNFKE